MITDLIDLLVDASNTFGSLVSSIQVRYKNYNKIISLQSPLHEDVVKTICAYFPMIQKEMNLCPNELSYIVIDKYSVKNGKTEIRVVFLDERQKHIHSFNVLSKTQTIGDLTIPSYWATKV